MRVWSYIFATLSVLVAVASTRGYFLPLALVMPDMAHYLATLPLPMWSHLVFAPLALLLGPVQLSTGLRAARPRLHRVLGYTYALSVLLAAAASLTLLWQFKGTLWAATGFAVLAALWIATTASGITLAIRGQTARHRVWMLRSLALTFAAVTLRLMMAPLIASGWTVLQTYDVTGWAAWLTNLAVLELWQRRGTLVVRLARSDWSGRRDSNPRP